MKRNKLKHEIDALELQINDLRAEIDRVGRLNFLLYQDIQYLLKNLFLYLEGNLSKMAFIKELHEIKEHIDYIIEDEEVKY